MNILEVVNSIIALFRVLNRVAGMCSSHTQNTYFNPPPVLFSPKQNRYFRLPETPSETILGHDAINLLIPPPGDRLVWDLFEYFEASETGDHTFSIGSTEMAVIRFGWHRKHAPLFYQLLNTDIHDFTRAPVKFLAQQGEVYPISIRIIGSGKRAPVYVAVKGVSREVRDQIVHIQPDDSAIFSSSSRQFFDDRGFRCFQYIPDEARSNEDMLTDYLPSEMVKGGIENDPIQSIRPQTISSPVIVEVFGHLKPALDGDYLVTFTYDYKIIIIGPGHEEKQTSYPIDATWTVFNDREFDIYEISLDRQFYYPFRLIAFVSTHDFKWGLVVTDPLGNEVDLFDIAASLSMASTHQTQTMYPSARKTEEASSTENINMK